MASAFVAGLPRPGTADKALYAWVVLDDAEVPTDALAAYVAERLPRYMVPGTTLVIPELSLTPNSKVDVSALPTPFEASGEPLEAPQTAGERAGVEARPPQPATVTAQENYTHAVRCRSLIPLSSSGRGPGKCASAS